MPDDNPPAFPGPETTTNPQGMSLRDWLAGQALLGLFRQLNYRATDVIPAAAYAIADAMLAERKK